MPYGGVFVAVYPNRWLDLVPYCSQIIDGRLPYSSKPFWVRLARRATLSFGKRAAHVKDLLAILRWAENPRDTVAGFRTLQLLPGTGPASAKKAALYLTEHRFDLGKLADFVPSTAAALAWPEFCRLLRDLQNGSIAWAGQIGACGHGISRISNGFTTTRPRVPAISNNWSRSQSVIPAVNAFSPS
jgi:hypothetical protein